MFIDLKLTNFSHPGGVPLITAKVAQYKDRIRRKTVALGELLLGASGSVVDATRLQEALFPFMAVDVFISHSHRDENAVIAMALELEAMGLKTFVDSCVWGHVDTVLNDIERDFSHKDPSARAKVAASVYMTLNAALHEVIDGSELFLFLQTKNSVVSNRDFGMGERVLSPWLYSELTFAQRVRRTPRRRADAQHKHAGDISLENFEENLNFAFKLPHSSHTLEWEKFRKWMKKGAQGNLLPVQSLSLQHLDTLYEMVGVGSEFLKSSR